MVLLTDQGLVMKKMCLALTSSSGRRAVSVSFIVVFPPLSTMSSSIFEAVVAKIFLAYDAKFVLFFSLLLGISNNHGMFFFIDF